MHPATGCLLAIAVLASSGCAVHAAARPHYGHGRHASQHVAFDRGYRDGALAGERDAQARRAYDYRRDRQYRDGLYGYHPAAGPRGEYQQLYRSGFESGYRDGYARLSGYPGRRDGGRAVPYGYGRGYLTPARDRGLADGYEKGREDARDNDRFDPRRHKWYRSGDRGYRREYGPRDDYARVYRDAFVQGYERGYRESRWRY